MSYAVLLILLLVFLFSSFAVYVLVKQLGDIGRTAITAEDLKLLQKLHEISEKQYVDLTRLSAVTVFNRSATRIAATIFEELEIIVEDGAFLRPIQLF